MRLDKYLANMGLGSRAAVKQLIKKGAVTVNDTICKNNDTHIKEGVDIVCVEGKAVAYEKHRYFMLHKPAGYVSATADNLYPTVIEILKDENIKDLFPVGRLDVDTEGLLIITDDGELSHRLLSPAHHVEKTYFAKIQGVVTAAHVEAFAAGLDIGDEKPTLPGRLIILSADENSGTSQVELTITEGRYHQVKRSFKALGMEVTYLKRISMGAVALDATLPKGAYRRLTNEELAALKG